MNDGRLLALLALLGVTAASVARSGSSARQPAFRTLAKVPSTFTTSPLLFVLGYTLEQRIDPDETGRASAGTGLFHVTTNLPAVLADGRLKSRRELRGANRQGAGLGGGGFDWAPGRVSVAVELEQALRIYRAVQTMALAVHGRIASADALERLKDSMRHALDTLDTAQAWMTAGEDEDEDVFVEARRFDDALVVAGREALVAPPGPRLYEALVAYELVVSNTLAEWAGRSWLSDEDMTCGAPVGFTEPSHKFERVLPENVGILKLAARRKASVEHINDECELRFKPEDLMLVGVWTEATPLKPKSKMAVRKPTARPAPRESVRVRVAAQEQGEGDAVYTAKNFRGWVWEVLLGGDSDTPIPTLDDALEMAETNGFQIEVLRG